MSLLQKSLLFSDATIDYPVIFNDTPGDKLISAGEDTAFYSAMSGVKSATVDEPIPMPCDEDAIIDGPTSSDNPATVEETLNADDITVTSLSGILIEASLDITSTVENLSETPPAPEFIHPLEENLSPPTPYCPSTEFFFPSQPSSQTSDSSRSILHNTAFPIRSKAEIARITFLGATSLDCFIKTLGFERPHGATTREDGCDAFATLAGVSTSGLDKVCMQRKMKLRAIRSTGS
ncbi:hypothetical protein CFE70_004255 [Pyrenophora teres f. teres 0-1]